MFGNAEKLFLQLCRKQWALWGTNGGSLLIIMAERAAQTKQHYTVTMKDALLPILNIFAAVYILCFLATQSLQKEHHRAESQICVRVCKILKLISNRICHHASSLHACLVCSWLLGFPCFVLVSQTCLHCIESSECATCRAKSTE